MAAGNTYEVIATYTLTSASTVTFSSIPQTYTDLIVVANCNNTVSGGVTQWYQIRVNGDSGTNYSVTSLTANGTTVYSSRAANYTFAVAGLTSNSSTIPSMVTNHFMNYSNTATYKTILSRASDSAQFVGVYANLWRNTSAITSITIYAESLTTYAAGSTFSLYGIKAA